MIFLERMLSVVSRQRWQRDGEEGIVGMVFVDFLNEKAHDFGTAGSEIVVFMGVVGQVIKCRLASLHNQFPIALAYTQHVGLVEFPVEVVVLPLPTLTDEGGKDTDTVATDCFTVRKPMVYELSLLQSQIVKWQSADAGDVTKRGQKVVEGKGLVALASRTYMAWPSYYERNADATLMGTALQASELSVVVEVCGVGTTFFVGSVVAGKDENGVLGQPAFLKKLHDLAHLGIQSRNHGSKLCMGFGCRIVA